MRLKSHSLELVMIHHVPNRTIKSASAYRARLAGAAPFQHWYRDNQVYFITARCRNRFPALRSSQAKAIFWERFEHYTTLHRFSVWIVTLLDNHYHVLGYLEQGDLLAPMMRGIHGSVAKLVNDTLEVRQVPFWREHGTSKNYFDGCIRDEIQCAPAYRYTAIQAQRHGMLRLAALSAYPRRGRA